MQLEEPTDQDVIARVLSGDVDQFATIVQRYQGAVFAIAVRVLGNRSAAADITQATFIQGFDQLARFDASRPFAPWINTIARNLVRDELRRLERHNRYLVHYRDAVAPDIALPGALQATEQRLQDLLENCLNGLQPTAAEVVRLHYECGVPLTEAAQRIGRTMVATRQLLFRARLALRACVEAAGAFE